MRRIEHPLKRLAALAIGCAAFAGAAAAPEPSSGLDHEGCILCGGPEALPCEDGWFCNLPLGQCAPEFYGTCTRIETACATVSDPVCGCDGQTHSNPCTARALGMSIAHSGRCATDCGGATGSVCPFRAYCRAPCSTSAGTCRPIPALCSNEHDPVCGCDGRSYENPCKAAQASVSIERAGVCRDVCLGDPDKVEPGVCGCGNPDIDVDRDGAPDCVDACPSDPQTRVAGRFEPALAINETWPCRHAGAAVGIGAGGRAVVAWQHGGGISARAIGAEGQGSIGEFVISDSGTGPDVGVDGAGVFIVAWTATEGDLQEEVLGQLHDANGVATGPPFTVNTSHEGTQTSSRVAMNSGGSFVVVWQSQPPAPAPGRALARRFDATGTPLGDEFPVEAVPSGSATPDVALSDSGEFIVAWQRIGDGVFFRMYDASGRPRSGERRVMADATAAAPSIVTYGTGEFAVAVRTHNVPHQEIYARRFDRNGLPRGPEFRIDSGMGLRFSPELAADATGNIVAVWDGADPAGSGNRDAHGRRFSSDGQPLGEEFLLNAFTVGSQLGPAVAAGPDGRFLAVWSSYWPFESQWGVFGARGRIVGDDDMDGAWDCHGPCEMLPPDVCCAPADGTLSTVDDGNPCTEDACALDGTVTHRHLGPGDIGPHLRLDKAQPGDGSVRLAWPPALPARSSDVYRGSIRPGTPWAYDEVCLAAGLHDGALVDHEVPAAGEAWTYLVGVADDACAGPIGVDEHGAPRFALTGCAGSS